MKLLLLLSAVQLFRNRYGTLKHSAPIVEVFNTNFQLQLHNYTALLSHLFVILCILESVVVN